MQAQTRQADRTAAQAAGTMVTRCWSCRGPVAEGAPFCPTCAAVQPPGQADHFARLGLPRGFGVDAADLDRRYFALQRQLHPDRFATRSAHERALSQQQATALNDAYETLKDPLRRADCLLKLSGQDVVAEGCNLVNDPELLMEAMERREALAEAGSTVEVDAITRATRADVAACVGGLAAAFSAGDLAAAGRLTTRLKYLQKLVDETRVRKLQLRG